MTHEQFIKVVNHDIYINPSYIIKLDFDRNSEIGDAVFGHGNAWTRESVYRKDVEHLITQ